MRIYATPEDLIPDWIPSTPEWMDTDPHRATRFIRAASQLVEHATRLARYRVDTNGLPADPQVATTFRDAVCQQVTVWINAGVDPDKGAGGQEAQVSSQSASGGSVSYTGTQTTQELGLIATTLCSQSWLILHNEGLTRKSVTPR